MTLAANPQAQDADQSLVSAASPPPPSSPAAEFLTPSSTHSDTRADRRGAERRAADRRQGDRRLNDPSAYVADDRRHGERRHGERRQLDRRLNDRLTARPAGPIAALVYRVMELLGFRRPRQFLIRYVYPWLLTSAYTVATVLFLVMALQQAVLGAQRNQVLLARYDQQVQQWHARVTAAQNLTAVAVAAVDQTLDGRTEVSVIMDGGRTTKIVADAGCAASKSLAVGSTVSVLQITGVSAIPPVFSANPDCLSPSSVAAAPGSAYAPPLYPLLSTVRAHLVLVGVGIFGMTLFVIGLRRRLQRLRYGIGNAINVKRRARRRDFIAGLGLSLMVFALLLYPMLDTLSPALRHLGLS